MSALTDAAKAVEEAREAVFWDCNRDSLRRLINMVRLHDAEIVRDEGTRYDERTYTRAEAARVFADRVKDRMTMVPNET